MRKTLAPILTWTSDWSQINKDIELTKTDEVIRYSMLYVEINGDKDELAVYEAKLKNDLIAAGFNVEYLYIDNSSVGVRLVNPIIVT